MCNCLQAFDPVFNASFLKRDSNNLSTQGRSLKEILEQHGKPLEPGKIVFTVDGVLTDEAPVSKQLASLQHRIAKLLIVQDMSLIVVDQLDNKEKVIGVLDYIKKNFAHERTPLFAFFAQLVGELHEINLIRTQALTILADVSDKKAINTILFQLDRFQKNIIAIEAVFNFLWQLLDRELILVAHDK